MKKTYPFVTDKNEILYSGKEYEMIFDGWKSFLDEVPDEEVTEILRRRTITGIPCGDESFLRKMSTEVGRVIIERKRGGYRKPVK